MHGKYNAVSNPVRYVFKVVHSTYIPCVQSLPVHRGEHVHIPGEVQFPPLKQPAGHSAV